MKIKDLLTTEELERCQTWGRLYNVDDLEVAIAQHYIEMDLKEFILFRLLDEIESMNLREDRKADAEGY